MEKQISIVFINIAPFGSSSSWSNERENIRGEYNNWLRALAESEPNVYLYDVAMAVSSGGVADDTDSIYMDSGLVNADGLHPSAAGQEVIAAELLKVLNGLPTVQ